MCTVLIKGEQSKSLVHLAGRRLRNVTVEIVEVDEVEKDVENGSTSRSLHQNGGGGGEGQGIELATVKTELVEKDTRVAVR